MGRCDNGWKNVTGQVKIQENAKISPVIWPHNASISKIKIKYNQKQLLTKTKPKSEQLFESLVAYLKFKTVVESYIIKNRWIN